MLRWLRERLLIVAVALYVTDINLIRLGFAIATSTENSSPYGVIEGIGITIFAVSCFGIFYLPFLLVAIAWSDWPPSQQKR